MATIYPKSSKSKDFFIYWGLLLFGDGGVERGSGMSEIGIEKGEVRIQKTEFRIKNCGGRKSEVGSLKFKRQNAKLQFKVQN